jgi:hypothetical protein
VTPTPKVPTVIDSKTPGRTHYKRLLENEHLGQWDLVTEDGRDLRPVVVIESVRPYTPPQRRKKKMPDGSYAFERNNKLLIAFVGKRKRWIAGPTIQKSIEGLYGPVLQDWIGKKVTLYVDHSVMMGPRKTGGIRVLNLKPTAEPTDDPLDREVDAELRSLQNEAFGREDENAPQEG